MATRPIRVWSGSDWEDVAIAPYDSGEFLSAATASATYLTQSDASSEYLAAGTASATYLPISASSTLGGGGFAKSFLLGGM